MNFKRNRSSRNRGSVAYMAFVATVPLVAAIGGFAVDAMHVNDARGELQRATDAAALAGAQDLYHYVGTKNISASSVAATNEEPVNYALTVAALNAVDGPIGLWQTGQRTVSADLQTDNTLYKSNQPNVCHVKGQIKISSLFAKIFGNYGQTVNTESWAAIFASNTYSNFMPLLVSLHDPDPSQNRLENMNLGQSYTVIIKDASNKSGGSNSVWIWNSNQDDINAIKHISDPIKYPTTPDFPVSIGQNVEDLIGQTIKSDNGQKSAGTYFDTLKDKTVVFVVTEDNPTDFLASGQPKHKIVGFMAMKVTDFDNKGQGNGFSLTGTLVKFPGGLYDPNGASNVLSGFIPYTARLVQ